MSQDETVETNDESKAKGGIARALSLTVVRRQEIAESAAAARWDTTPLASRAARDGFLSIGDTEVQCQVLDDGTRILSTRRVLKALGRSWRGRKYFGIESAVFQGAKRWP